MMTPTLRLIIAAAALLIGSCILTGCKSELDDNQSVISGVGPDGKITVEGAILKNNTRHADFYSGYLSNVGPMSKEARDEFLQWLSENVDVNYICAAILDDGSLSILYRNKENHISEMETDFRKRPKRDPQSSKSE